MAFEAALARRGWAYIFGIAGEGGMRDCVQPAERGRGAPSSRRMRSIYCIIHMKGRDVPPRTCVSPQTAATCTRIMNLASYRAWTDAVADAAADAAAAGGRRLAAL